MLLNQFEIFFYSLATAFVIVKVFAWPELKFKPFNCLMCLTSWICLFLGIVSGYGLGALLLMVGGLFIGAIAEGILMRWL